MISPRASRLGCLPTSRAVTSYLSNPEPSVYGDLNLEKRRGVVVTPDLVRSIGKTLTKEGDI